MRKTIDLVILTIVGIFAIYILAIVFDSIYNREGIVEEIIKEKQELGY